MGSVHGRARVITQRDESGACEVMTFAGVAQAAANLAAGLRDLGVAPGDRVGSLAWNTQEHLALYYAVPCMGAVLHTVNLRLHPEQIAYTINHAGDKVLFVDETLLPIFEPVAPLLETVKQVVVIGSTAAGWPPEAITFQDVLGSGHASVDWPLLDERDGAALCYTSGTTGNPKGVLYSHRSLTIHTLIESAYDAYRISERDTVLAIVPMFHAMAWNIPYLCGMTGTDLVLPGRFLQAPALARMLVEHEVTASAGVPTIWMDLLRHAEVEGLTFETLELAICGGSQVPPQLMHDYEERHGVALIQGWGMTETLPGATLAHDPPALEHHEGRWEYRATAGRISPFYELRVVGPDGAVLPNDGLAAGELEIRGPAVASGYYGNPDGAADNFHDGWLRTGDAGSIDADGWMKLTDRLKDVIKSGGEWISSVELESALVAHPAVLEAAVVARPDDRWGERPLACIVVDGEVTPDELRVFLEGRVARWWVPDSFVVVGEIPKTSVGKIDKRRMRALLLDGGSLGTELSLLQFRLLRAISFAGVAESPGDLIGVADNGESLEEDVASLRRAGLLEDDSLLLPTSEGEAVLKSWYESERERFGGSAADKLLEDFRPLDLEVKSLSTKWQEHVAAGDVEGRLDVLEQLGRVHEGALAFIERYADILPRLDEYALRLRRAYDRTLAGEDQYFVGVQVDSYHTAWFHFHEDLLRVLGRTRESR
jgi:fatty-acyl-CoA synthase